MNRKEKTNVIENKISKHKKENDKYECGVSDDPFEIFFDNYGDNMGEVLKPQDGIKKSKISFIEETQTDKQQSKRSTLTDIDFMNILKSTTKKKVVKSEAYFGICQQIKLLTNKEVKPFKMTLYKFPFEMNLKYENSAIFKQIYKIFIGSLKDAFKKYKEDKKEFFIKFNADFLHFSTELKATKGIKKILVANEITFSEKGDYIYVPSNEICLVVDIILNLNLTRSSTIPFILSTFSFENAMIYTSYLKKIRTIKQEGDIYSSYILYGPIWLDLCSNFLEHNNKIVW